MEGKALFLVHIALVALVSKVAAASSLECEANTVITSLQSSWSLACLDIFLNLTAQIEQAAIFHIEAENGGLRVHCAVLASPGVAMHACLWTQQVNTAGQSFLWLPAPGHVITGVAADVIEGTSDAGFRFHTCAVLCSSPAVLTTPIACGCPAPFYESGGQCRQATVGTKGNKGFEGAKGVTGDKGDTGFTGVIGDVGDSGVIGSTGSVGSKGLKGDTGVLGQKGVKGQAGNKGDIASKGAVGAPGAAGDLGGRGADGDTGLKGSRGPEGAAGDKGVLGLTGDKGDLGRKGILGGRGSVGVAGDKGIKGVEGDEGVKGRAANLTWGDDLLDASLSLQAALSALSQHEATEQARVSQAMTSSLLHYSNRVDALSHYAFSRQTGLEADIASLSSYARAQVSAAVQAHEAAEAELSVRAAALDDDADTLLTSISNTVQTVLLDADLAERDIEEQLSREQRDLAAQNSDVADLEASVVQLLALHSTLKQNASTLLSPFAQLTQDEEVVMSVRVSAAAQASLSVQSTGLSIAAATRDSHVRVVDSVAGSISLLSSNTDAVLSSMQRDTSLARSEQDHVATGATSTALHVQSEGVTLSSSLSASLSTLSVDHESHSRTADVMLSSTRSLLSSEQLAQQADNSATAAHVASVSTHLTSSVSSARQRQGIEAATLDAQVLSAESQHVSMHALLASSADSTAVHASGIMTQSSSMIAASQSRENTVLSARAQAQAQLVSSLQSAEVASSLELASVSSTTSSTVSSITQQLLSLESSLASDQQHAEEDLSTTSTLVSATAHAGVSTQTSLATHISITHVQEAQAEASLSLEMSRHTASLSHTVSMFGVSSVAADQQHAARTSSLAASLSLLHVEEQTAALSRSRHLSSHVSAAAARRDSLSTLVSSFQISTQGMLTALEQSLESDFRQADSQFASIDIAQATFGDSASLATSAHVSSMMSLYAFDGGAQLSLEAAAAAGEALTVELQLERAAAVASHIKQINATHVRIDSQIAHADSELSSRFASLESTQVDLLMQRLRNDSEVAAAMDNLTAATAAADASIASTTDEQVIGVSRSMAQARVNLSTAVDATELLIEDNQKERTSVEAAIEQQLLVLSSQVLGDAVVAYFDSDASCLVSECDVFSLSMCRTPPLEDLLTVRSAVKVFHENWRLWKQSESSSSFTSSASRHVSVVSAVFQSNALCLRVSIDATIASTSKVVVTAADAFEALLTAYDANASSIVYLPPLTDDDALFGARVAALEESTQTLSMANAQLELELAALEPRWTQKAADLQAARVLPASSTDSLWSMPVILVVLGLVVIFAALLALLTSQRQAQQAGIYASPGSRTYAEVGARNYDYIREDASDNGSAMQDYDVVPRQSVSSLRRRSSVEQMMGLDGRRISNPVFEEAIEEMPDGDHISVLDLDVLAEEDVEEDDPTPFLF